MTSPLPVRNYLIELALFCAEKVQVVLDYVITQYASDPLALIKLRGCFLWRYQSGKRGVPPTRAFWKSKASLWDAHKPKVSTGKLKSANWLAIRPSWFTA